MLFRSTGLGKTILTGKIVELQHTKETGDYVILHIDTLEPVLWRIRAALSFRDMVAVIIACIKVSIISFILSPKQWFNKDPKRPDDF